MNNRVEHKAGTTVLAVDKATGAEYGYRMGPGLAWTVVMDGADAGTYPTKREACAALGSMLPRAEYRFYVPYDGRG